MSRSEYCNYTFPIGFVKIERTNYNKNCEGGGGFWIMHAYLNTHQSIIIRYKQRETIKKRNAFWECTIYCSFEKLSNQLCFAVQWPDKCISNFNQCLLQSDPSLWHICHLLRGTIYCPISLNQLSNVVNTLLAITYQRINYWPMTSFILTTKRSMIKPRITIVSNQHRYKDNSHLICSLLLL